MGQCHGEQTAEGEDGQHRSCPAEANAVGENAEQHRAKRDANARGHRRQASERGSVIVKFEQSGERQRIGRRQTHTQTSEAKHAHDQAWPHKKRNKEHDRADECHAQHHLPVESQQHLREREAAEEHRNEEANRERGGGSLGGAAEVAHDRCTPRDRADLGQGCEHQHAPSAP